MAQQAMETAARDLRSFRTFETAVVDNMSFPSFKLWFYTILKLLQE
jgi:hypothetical protein